MDLQALKVRLDHGQSRVRRERLCTVTQGAFVPAGLEVKSGWSPSWGTKTDGVFSTWIDPITKTLMLTPAPLLPGWGTSGSGIYARLAKSDFTLATAALWYESPKDGVASKYLVLSDADAADADKIAITTATYDANRPFYVSWFDWNWGNEKTLRLACGWGNTGGYDSTDGVTVAFYADGQAEVLKDGDVLGTYPYGGKDDDETGQALQSPQRFISAMMFPMAAGLLVVTNQGGGFFHAFEGMDENDPTQVITPSAKFWFQCIGKGEVEVAPIKFPTTAYRSALKTVWMEAPEAGEEPSFTIYSAYSTTSPPAEYVTADLANTLANTDFIPDGTTRDCRVRLTLTGDGSSTPYVFGVMGTFDPITEETDATEELDLTPNVTELTLSIPEDAGGVRLTLSIRDVDELDPEGLALIQENGSRPLALDFVDAATEARTIIDGITLDPSVNDAVISAAEYVKIVARDWWEVFETVTFSDDVPLDGMTLKDAYTFLVKTGGLADDQIDIGADAEAYLLPQTSASRGEWTLLIKRGDSVATWLDRLHDEHCPTYYMALRPSPDPVAGKVFVLKSPEEQGREPVIRIFHKKQWAVDYLTGQGETEADARYMASHLTYRDSHRSPLRPEANDVWVMGIDRRTMRPMLAHYPRRDAQTVTTKPSERVRGWRGLIHKYGLYLPSLNTRSVLFRACKLLYKRLCFQRRLIEWSSDFLIDPATLLPVWRGDVVELQHGSHEESTIDPDTQVETITVVPDLYLVRVKSLDMRVVLDIEDPSEERPPFWRPTSYTGEILADLTEEGDIESSDGLGHKSMAKTLMAAAAEFGAKVLWFHQTGPEPSGAGAKPPIDVYILPDDDDEG